MKRRSILDILVPLGLLAGALLFWEMRVIAPATVRGGLLPTDYYTLMYPRYLYGYGEILAGRIPLWNPYDYCGIPFLATLEVGILYPGNFLFLFLPTGLAMGMTVVLHTFLTAYFMFLLGRAWGWSRPASGVAALTWAYSHNVVWFYGPICFLASAAWIPLMALGVERICSGRKVSGAALLGFAGTMSLLAGGMQTFVYGSYAIAAVAAVRLWSVMRMHGARAVASATFWLLVGTVTAAAFASPQILPTYELAKQTERRPGSLSLRWAKNPMMVSSPAGVSSKAEKPAPQGWAKVPLRITSGLVSVWTLSPGKNVVLYFGIVPPLLGIVALFGKKRRLAMALIGGGGIALLLSMGPQTPFYKYYYALPTGNWFRNSNRFALLISLIMASLAGLGVMTLQAGGASARRGLTAAGLAVVAGSALLALSVDSMADLLRTILVAVAGLIVLGIMTSRGGSGIGRKAAAVLVIIIFAEFYLAYENHYYHPQKDPEVFDEHADVADYLRANIGAARIVIADVWWKGWAVQPKYGLLHHLRTLNDYEPLSPVVYKTLFHLLANGPPDEFSPFDGRLRLSPKRSNKKVLDMLGVRYVLVDQGLTAVWEKGAKAFGLRKLRVGAPEVALYENPEARPRASLVPAAVVTDTDEDVVRVIQDEDFNPARLVVIRTDEAEGPGGTCPGIRAYRKEEWKSEESAYLPTGSGTVRIIKDQPDNVEIEAIVEPGRPSWLLLMDLNFPGWQARVDGEPAAIWTADLAGRAVALPPGRHRVEFRYHARMFRLGCWLALLTAAAWGGGVLLRARATIGRRTRVEA
jgi:hypothetical protein